MQPKKISVLSAQPKRALAAGFASILFLLIETGSFFAAAATVGLAELPFTMGETLEMGLEEGPVTHCHSTSLPRAPTVLADMHRHTNGLSTDSRGRVVCFHLGGLRA